MTKEVCSRGSAGQLRIWHQTLQGQGACAPSRRISLPLTSVRFAGSVKTQVFAQLKHGGTVSAPGEVGGKNCYLQFQGDAAPLSLAVQSCFL